MNRLVVLGASDSTGYGTTGWAPTVAHEYCPTRYAWAARVARNAAAEWGTETTVLAHNGALMTDWTSTGRWSTTRTAVDKVGQIQPDMILMGGILVNEYVNNVDPEVAATRLSNLIYRLQTAAPQTLILLLTYPNIQWAASTRPWSAYTSKIHQTAVANGCGLLDLQQYIDSPQTTGALGVWTSDMAHMGDAGQAAVSAAVWTLLWTTQQ